MQALEQTITAKKASMVQQDEIKIVIAVWNLQGTIPPRESIKLMLDRIINGMFNSVPDLICIATQECQRSIGMSFVCESKNEWQHALEEYAVGYRMTVSQTMNAMHTGIFIREEIADCFTTQKKTIFKAGFCNCFGNKGAISLVINLLGKNLQFVNCHLEAHQNQCQRRNQVLINIAQHLVQKNNQTQVFICGDFNYRIEMTREEYKNLLENKKNTDEQLRYRQMLNKDQLINQQSLMKNFLPFYQQLKINFPPTYKMAENSLQYNKKRIPGWTDRIFHRKGKVEQKKYQCMYDVYGTDHRPVIASFQMNTGEGLSIFPDEFVVVKKASRGCSLI